MLYLLPWLSSLAVITSSSVAIDQILPVPTSVVSCVDTGGTQDSLVLLTPTVVTPYAAVEKALTAYWAAHPERVKTANDHGHVLKIDVGRNKTLMASTGFTIPDYPTVVQQDTAIAAIFTQNHMSPAQFEPTARTVRSAIAAVIQQQTADSATVIGKNLAFVQVHRPELAIDWSEVQVAVQTSQGMLQMMQNSRGGQGQDSSLNP